MALWSLFETARTTDGLPGTFLRLLVMVIVSCLRYTHLCRVVDVNMGYALVSGVVSKGKRLVKGSPPPSVLLGSFYTPHHRHGFHSILRAPEL